MDKTTNRAIARAKLEGCLNRVEPEKQGILREVLQSWDDLSRKDGFDTFTGSISVLAQSASQSRSEAEQKLVLRAVCAQCESFLKQQQEARRIAPATVGLGKTGLKNTIN